MTDYAILNNGLPMPCLGLGVWRMKDGPEVEAAVRAALETGYRSIDTAASYGNEVGVGNGIKASNVPREQLFVTTKVWNADQGYGTTLKAFDESKGSAGRPGPGQLQSLFLKAARQIDVPPERCVVVEDAVAGVEAAKRAGMKCIAVTTTNPGRALDEADVVVERLDELPPDVFSQLLGEAGAQ